MQTDQWLMIMLTFGIFVIALINVVVQIIIATKK